MRTAPLATLAAIALLTACSNPSDRSDPSDASDGGVSLQDAAALDASTGGADAGAADAATSTNAPCVFNQDCIAAERCDYDVASDTWACRVGARGTGKNGIDPCNENGYGLECESGMCITTSSNVSTCSGPCVTDDDCEALLPICRYVTILDVKLCSP